MTQSERLVCYLLPLLVFFSLVSNITYKDDCERPLARSCIVDLETFPIHMVVKVWVDVKNALGSERSDELIKDSSYFGMISAFELGKDAFYTV